MITCALFSLDSGLFPSKATQLFRATFPYLPKVLLALTYYTPTRLHGRFRAINKMFASVGKPRLQAGVQDGAAAREGQKDVLSMLGESDCFRATIPD